MLFPTAEMVRDQPRYKTPNDLQVECRQTKKGAITIGQVKPIPQWIKNQKIGHTYNNNFKYDDPLFLTVIWLPHGHFTSV